MVCMMVTVFVGQGVKVGSAGGGVSVATVVGLDNTVVGGVSVGTDVTGTVGVEVAS